MNTFVKGLKNTSNYKVTENGAVALKSTLNKVYDMFAFGGAYRSRTDADCITLFEEALSENETLALRCLFYLRDVRGGQGERRYFRVCMKWLANKRPEIARRLLEIIPEYGRWDDLYIFIDTPLEKEMFNFMRKQIIVDAKCKTPSLLAKWLKSENTSSKESCVLGTKTRKAFGMTSKQYRQMLSALRKRINILERLMSENRWDEIEFDKIPSRAGFIYRNAFARRDIIKAKYEAFAKDENSKVNAKTLYPYECVYEALNCKESYSAFEINANREMINKYWANLADYIKGASFNGLALVDVSGSMYGIGATAPINVAISLGMYCATKCTGPFANHFITFESNPKFVEITGHDFVQKVKNIHNSSWGYSTNLAAAFQLMLNTAINNHCSQDEIPQNLIIISDMEINSACGNYRSHYYNNNNFNVETTMEHIRKEWERHGYQMPHLVFWDVNARNNTILDSSDNVTYVSGMSPVIYEQILSGKTSIDLMLDKLNSKRYSIIK